MIRQPTPIMRLLAWHRSFMRGEEPPRHDGLPECGWFKMQRVKNGAWIPVTIWCDREIDEFGELTCDETLRADVFGDDECSEEIWTFLTPISKISFERLTEFRLKSQHKLNDMRPIDLGSAPTPPRG